MSQQVIELLSLIDTIHPDCPVSTDIHELLACWNTGIKKKACFIHVLGLRGKRQWTVLKPSPLNILKVSTIVVCCNYLDKVQEGVFGSVYRIKGCFSG